MAEIKWAHFPRDRPPNPTVRGIVDVFIENQKQIDSGKFGKSGSNENKTKFNSDAVLEILSEDLKKIPDMEIEEKDPKTKKKKLLKVAVLYGSEGKVEKPYHPDGLIESEGILLEIECGLMIPQNKAHLKDLFKACLIHGIDHFVIAGAINWEGSDGTKYSPYNTMKVDFEAMYESTRFQLPFESLTVIGF